jgi:hypothetical protein
MMGLGNVSCIVVGMERTDTKRLKGGWKVGDGVDRCRGRGMWKCL